MRRRPTRSRSLSLPSPRPTRWRPVAPGTVRSVGNFRSTAQPGLQNSGHRGGRAWPVVLPSGAGVSFRASHPSTGLGPRPTGGRATSVWVAEDAAAAGAHRRGEDGAGWTATHRIMFSPAPCHCFSRRFACSYHPRNRQRSFVAVIGMVNLGGSCQLWRIHGANISSLMNDRYPRFPPAGSSWGELVLGWRISAAAWWPGLVMLIVSSNCSMEPRSRSGSCCDHHIPERQVIWRGGARVHKPSRAIIPIVATPPPKAESRLSQVSPLYILTVCTYWEATAAAYSCCRFGVTKKQLHASGG